MAWATSLCANSQGCEMFGGDAFDKEASQTRDYCVAKNATLRAARPDSSRRKERLLGMTIKLHHQMSRRGER
jgi:hypothetical protein